MGLDKDEVAKSAFFGKNCTTAKHCALFIFVTALCIFCSSHRVLFEPGFYRHVHLSALFKIFTCFVVYWCTRVTFLQLHDSYNCKNTGDHFSRHCCNFFFNPTRYYYRTVGYCFLYMLNFQEAINFCKFNKTCLLVVFIIPKKKNFCCQKNNKFYT